MFGLGRKEEIERARDCAERAAEELLSQNSAGTQKDRDIAFESFGGGHGADGHGDGHHGDGGGAILKCAQKDMHHAKRFNAELLDVDPSGAPGGGTGAILEELRNQFSWDKLPTSTRFFDKCDRVGALLLAHYRQFEDLSRGLVKRLLVIWFLIALLGLLPYLKSNGPAEPIIAPAPTAFDEFYFEPPAAGLVRVGLQGEVRPATNDAAGAETPPDPGAGPAQPDYPAPQPAIEPPGSQTLETPVSPPPFEPAPRTDAPQQPLATPLPSDYVAVYLTPYNVAILQCVLFLLSAVLTFSKMSTLYMACANGFLIVRNRFRTALMLYFHDLYALVDKACSSAQSSTVSNRRDKQENAYNAAIEALYLGRGADNIVQYATHCLKRVTQSIQMENMGYFPGRRLRALPGMPEPFWWHIGSKRVAVQGGKPVFYFPTKRLLRRTERQRTYLPIASIGMFVFLVFWSIAADIGVQLFLKHSLEGKPIPDLTMPYCQCQEFDSVVAPRITQALNGMAIMSDFVGPIAEERWVVWLVLAAGMGTIVYARHIRRATRSNFAVQLLRPKAVTPSLVARFGLLGEHVDPAGSGAGFSLEPDSHGHYFEAVGELVREIWSLVHSQKTHYPDN